MDDNSYSLVPVDYQPNFSDYSLVPVDYDPFSGEGTTQPPPIQLAQTQVQPAQTQPETPPLQPATGVGQPDVVAPTVSAQTAAPIQPNPYAAGYPTSNSPYGPSIVNAV
jgi:hypothetical protein